MPSVRFTIFTSLVCSWAVRSIFSFGMTFPSRSLCIAKRFSSRSSSLLATATSKTEYDSKKVMPITILSGFLGAGKTSFLQHVLNSQNGAKFGLVVNDMATVNVDAKLLKTQNIGEGVDGVETLELQNGCVCCSLAEDLIASVSQLVTIAERKEANYDHVIVECSGIAEPRKIRDLFQEAEDQNYPLLRRLKLNTMITLVDAVVFLETFGTDKDFNTNPELAYRLDDSAGSSMLIDGTGLRKVTELLLEQVECADIVLINKCDLLQTDKEMQLVKNVIASINPTARIITCVRGEISDPLDVLGSAKGEGAASWGVLFEHKKLVETAEKSDRENAAAEAAALLTKTTESEVHDAATCTDPTHDHSHDAATCTDPTHDHSHDAATCTDPTHDHSHDAATCTDPTHDHSHDAATCTDPTHDHSHSSTSHSHGPGTTTAEERFGLTSFVYKRRTPFHPARFSLFLQGLGKLSVKGISEIAGGAKTSGSGDTDALKIAKKSLMRSKGFVWMGTSKSAAYFISHAGQYLELMVLGRWWADIDKADWPKGSEDEISADFQGAQGDRRQEMVFIGQFGKDSGSSRQALEEVLDSCLLTPEEMIEYEKVSVNGDEALRGLFFPANA